MIFFPDPVDLYSHRFTPYSWYQRMLQFIFCCCNETMSRNNWKRKGLFSHYRLQSIFTGGQGKRLETGTKVETIEECFLLALYPGLLKRLSYTIQNYLLGSSMAHNGLNPPPSTSNQEDAPTDQCDEGNSLIKSLSS